MTRYCKILAENILFRLEKLDRRVAWLAKESKVAPSTIGRLLSCETSPSLEVIEALALALNCKPHELLEPNKKLAKSENSKKPESIEKKLDLALELLQFQNELIKKKINNTDESSFLLLTKEKYQDLLNFEPLFNQTKQMIDIISKLPEASLETRNRIRDLLGINRKNQDKIIMTHLAKADFDSQTLITESVIKTRKIK
ncbi:MAG: helix-turn-helix domain-containing protein [Pseudobdellovibrionaceae bacterium]